jgi:hypothetical protein
VRRLVVAVLMSLAPATAAAQGVSTTGTVTATVTSTPTTVLIVQSLDFASVAQGIPKTLPRNVPGAAKVRISGSANAFAQITFTLPAQLPRISGGPPANMPVSFGATSAGWSRDVDDATASTAFNPVTGATGRFGPPPRPYLWVYLGGTANPSVSQASGTYQGTIILTITYL